MTNINKNILVPGKQLVAKRRGNFFGQLDSKNPMCETGVSVQWKNGCGGKLRRAVITVEASYIVPWTVILLALVITLTFFVHNRVWYTAAACETALSGNRYVEGSGGTGSAGYVRISGGDNAAGSRHAEETLRQRIRDQAMPGGEPERKITCTADETEVKLSGQDFPIFSDLFSWSVGEKVKKIRPVQVVRGKWILAGIAHRAGEAGL